MGWKLPDIAARLKIRRVFLEAIESGNLTALPAPTYAAGFIRSYAEIMGLDPEEILRRFRAEGMSRSRPPALSFPEPLPDRAVPPGAVLFLVAAVGLAGYFFWYRHSEHELRMARMVPEVPAKLAPLAIPKSSAPTPAPAPAKTAAAGAPASGTSAPAPSAATPPAASASAGAPPAATAQASASQAAVSQTASSTPPGATPGTPAASTPGSAAADSAMPNPTAGTGTADSAANPGGNSGAVIAGTSASTAAGTPAAAAGTAAAGTTPPGTAATSALPAGQAPAAAASVSANPLVISASADSWVEVRGPHGTILFSRVLKAGQSWPVPNEPGLTMTTGNAGGTELVRNGTAGAPLGKPGAVLHSVPLTPAAPAGGATAPVASPAAQ
ncbi:MAG: XRE family transcriptional regulator [Acidiphilium sp. 21-68-69]|nr:MAG: XRE family transcriptional regulator [Acidiphilium sp. 21-68-69]